MTYELAKELKDAGFPQRGGEIGTRDRETGSESVYAPTLSELIEACGNRLTVLENWGEGWTAYEEQLDLIGKEAKGKTPEEAVAKLYIALYNKGNAKSNKDSELN